MQHHWQNPKALGVTIPELELDSLEASQNPLGKAIPKSLFSMMTPEVSQSLQDKGIKSVIMVGIGELSQAVRAIGSRVSRIPRLLSTNNFGSVRQGH